MTIDPLRPRPSWRFWCAGAIALSFALGPPAWFWWRSVYVPGSSFAGALPALTAAQSGLARELERDVRIIAGAEQGERNLLRPRALERTAQWIEAELRGVGYAPQRQSYVVDGQPVHNVEVELKGGTRPSELIVVGAHYDSAHGTAGANDNGSGVAALLALARRMHGRQLARSVRLVWFANEEPPHFQTADMGSLRYAYRAKKHGVRITGMLSLETMGYFSDTPESQHYPAPLSLFYPDRGNFIAFVGNRDSRDLLHQAIAAFRQHARFPSEGAALSESLPGVGWSDHWAFWQQGFPALMVTDTAPFRYPHYHSERDLPEQLDYARLARVVDGLQPVIAVLASE